MIVLAAVAVEAELPPSAYRKWQMEAPEALEIEVKKAMPAAATKTVTVQIDAVVTKVTRTATNLKRGSKIRISYLHQIHERRIAGPSSIPLLHTGDTVPAFLYRGNFGAYEPAAGGYSFSALIPAP